MTRNSVHPMVKSSNHLDHRPIFCGENNNLCFSFKAHTVYYVDRIYGRTTAFPPIGTIGISQPMLFTRMFLVCTRAFEDKKWAT